MNQKLSYWLIDENLTWQRGWCVEGCSLSLAQDKRLPITPCCRNLTSRDMFHQKSTLMQITFTVASCSSIHLHSRILSSLKTFHWTKYYKLKMSWILDSWLKRIWSTLTNYMINMETIHSYQTWKKSIP